jgi:hypothetical protein
VSVRASGQATSLPVVRATLRLIRDKYVDPARLAPRESLLSALRQIEKEDSSVVVSKGDSAATIVVQAGGSQQAFRIDDVSGPWDVAARLREVFVFLRAQLGSDRRVDFKKLEYAACVGLLASVDKHDLFVAPGQLAASPPGNRAGAGVADESARNPIESRKLRPGIGYVRIKSFQRSTAVGLNEVLTRLQREGSLNGLVLDLRDNSGGLLDEAAKVADVFLEEGSIVTVRGSSEGEEKKLAKKDETEPHCPLVILINSATASGSELVASALKDNQRALVLGETSFGVGRIQLVFPRVAGEAVIKLTIAEFQAPAGTPIQDVGVMPHIALRPVVLEPGSLRFFGPTHRARESDPMRMFPNVAKASQPVATLWYQAAFSKPDKRVDFEGSATADAQADSSVQLAAELVAQLPKGELSQQIESARAFVASRQAREMSAIEARLKTLGVDWQPPPESKGGGPRASDFDVRVTTDGERKSAAESPGTTLVVAVTNRSRLPAYRLRAITMSDNEDYRDKELLFGRIDPGKTVTRKLSLGQCEARQPPTSSATSTGGSAQRERQVAPCSASRKDMVKVVFAAEGGEAPMSARVRPTPGSDGPQGGPRGASSPARAEPELGGTFAPSRPPRSPPGPTSPTAKSSLWPY